MRHSKKIKLHYLSAWSVKKKICLLARGTFMQNKRKKIKGNKESKFKKQTELEEGLLLNNQEK